MKRKRLLLVTLICGLLITLFPLGATAAPTPSPPSQEEPECNPMAIFLANLMGEDCEDLMDYQVDGVDVGFGVIMKAYFLSQMFDLDWTNLVERHMSEEGLGWGQIMKAYFLASVLEDVDAEDLLEMRETMGWGVILKPYRGEEPGKPPWAGPHPRPWAHRGECPPSSRSPRCAE